MTGNEIRERIEALSKTARELHTAVATLRPLMRSENAMAHYGQPAAGGEARALADAQLAIEGIGEWLAVAETRAIEVRAHLAMVAAEARSLS